jgi:hypothetical protein
MEIHRPLDHHAFGDIRVQAFGHPVLAFHGGPVLPDPNFTQLRHKRQDGVFDSFDENAQFDARLPGEWVYVGPKYHHFGHIMSEMIHRILASKLFFPDVQKYLLVTTSDDGEQPGFAGLCRAYQEVLEFCEIAPKDVHVLHENSVVERLLICEQGANFGGVPSPWYLEILRDFSARRLDQIHGSRRSPDKVYVSKSKITHGGTILGERYLERLLRDEGFFVLHPEELSFSLQMDWYRKAKELIFSEGSACHGTELLGTQMLDRSFVLVRRMEMRPDLMNILGSRSRQFGSFVDTFPLGTIAVHPETREPYMEFSVSIVDMDRLVSYLRDQRLARLDDVDLQQYFDAAEEDLKAYFSYHMASGIAQVDAWRLGDVRMEFEKIRRRFLAGHRLPASARLP